MTNQEKLEMSICDLNLSVRTVNALQENLGVITVRDLLMLEPHQILAVPNVAKKTLEQIYAALEQIGFFRQGRKAG